MAEKPPEDAGGTADNTPETVTDLRQAVDQKLDDLFGGLDEDEEPTVTVLQEGAEIELPNAAPAFDADRSKPAAATAPRKPPAEPPADSKAVEHHTAPVPVPPPKPRPDPPKAVATPPPEASGPAAAPPKKADRKGAVERSAAQPKPASAPPPKTKKPVTAPAPSTGHAKAKPQLGRLLLWGAVLGVVAGTAAYFTLYEPKAPPASTAGRGMLFHKIAPVSPAPFGQKSDQSTVTAPAAASMPAPADQKHATPPNAPHKAVEAYIEGSYPWAIHIASYRHADVAREKAAEYYRGFQAFLVYTDLGEKGVWYRLHFGHFPDATSALDAIKKYGLKDAVVGHTRYACLLGSYATMKEARAATDRLNARGFFPYIITLNNSYHVLVGAHPTAGGAENVSGELRQAGFTNRVIKR